MLDYGNLYVTRVKERPVVAGSTVTAEGMALVAANVNGAFGVAPSTGAAGEQFMGVSLAQQLYIDYLPAVEELTVGTDATVTLNHTATAGTIRVIDLTANATLAQGSVATTGHWDINDKTVSVNADAVGHTLRVSYRYSPSVVEAKIIQGDIPPGGAAGLLLNSVGVIEVGDVYTSEYDTTADWSGVPVVRLGPGGIFTTSGNGVVLSNVRVIHQPAVGTSQAAFLGLRIQ